MIIELTPGTSVVDGKGKVHTLLGHSVLVPKVEFDELTMAHAKLGALEVGGVDNWEWYSDSLRDHMEPAMYRKLTGDEEDDGT